MTTPNITTVEQLIEARIVICAPMREWLAAKGITTLAEAWDRCHRADWMLWLDKALDLLSDRERRLIACRCVRETPLIDGRKVWDLLIDERSLRAVEVAERHARGDATDEQLAVAWTAAMAAAQAASRAAAEARVATRASAVPELDAAAFATWAATEAATAWATEGEEDEDLNASWAAAADARDAAQAAAAYPEDTATWDAARAAQADLIREIAGNPWRGNWKEA